MRKCKTNLQKRGEDIEVATQNNLFMGENTVLHPSKRSGIRTRGSSEPNNSVDNQQQMPHTLISTAMLAVQNRGTNSLELVRTTIPRMTP